MGALTDNQRSLLRTLACRIVPDAAHFTDAQHASMLALVDDALGARQPGMRRQFALFLNVLRLAPLVRYGRTLDRLDGARQDAVLRFFQDAPIQLVRSGFWGVRTLIFIGCYGRPDAGAAIGYSPSTDGNAVLHARARR